MWLKRLFVTVVGPLYRILLTTGVLAIGVGFVYYFFARSANLAGIPEYIISWAMGLFCFLYYFTTKKLMNRQFDKDKNILDDFDQLEK